MSPYLVLLILEFFPARLATLPYGLDSNVTRLRANLLTKPPVFYYMPIVSCNLVLIKLLVLLLCRAYAGPHDIVYNTTKTVCMLVRPKQSQGRFSTRVRLGNEELSFVEKFSYLGHIMTADCGDEKDNKKQFRRQNAVGNILVIKFSFAPIEAKIQLFKSYCYPIYGCALWCHSFQNSIRKLTVSYSDTFKPLINVPRYTSSSLAFVMNVTDHINACLTQISLQHDEQSSIASPNSIVTAIINSDAYHQSPLMEK